MNIKNNYILLFSFFIGISIVYFFYDWSLPNTSFEKEGYLYIPTGSNFKDVVSIE